MTRLMSPKHGPRRALVVFHSVAEEQIERMTDNERTRLDPALVEISRNPLTAGKQISDGLEREYRQDGVRVIYLPTVLGTVVLVAYVEA
jgi:hypothetical protein